MKKVDVTWKIFTGYMLVLFFMLLANSAFSQIQVTQFNAGWNSANEVPWVMKLTDCNTRAYIDISADKEAQSKYKIAVIPTIIIFKDDIEVARFQADLSLNVIILFFKSHSLVDCLFPLVLLLLLPPF